MSKGSKVHAACNVARFYEISYVEGVKRNKNTHNTLDLRHLCLMSMYIYNVDSNMNYIKI